MDSPGNIVIADGSALHLYGHIDGLQQIKARDARGNPLRECATTSAALTAFNTRNGFYGGEPVSLLVNDIASRRSSSHITCHSCSYELPAHSFVQLRESLFLTSPQLTFVRMAAERSQAAAAAIGMTLCAGYYLDLNTDEILERRDFLVTPAQLRDYIRSVPGLRGAAAAERALRWVLPNSKSPEETRTKLQYCQPLWDGGFNLPFDAMNYDVQRGGLVRLTDQTEFSIDLADTKRKFGLEYDGAYTHLDPSKDKRRRNALAALGWTIFPIDSKVLYDPVETERTAYQIAHRMGIRIRKPKCWEEKFIQLRKSLSLPV